MDRADIQVFIDGLVRFLSKNLGDEIQVGEVSAVSPPELVVYDLTGVIGLSGAYKGCVYFTTEKGVVEQILRNLGEEEIDDDLLNDMTGEIANTIAGNASANFGPQYQMSVPVVVTGRPDSIYLPKNLTAYVTPVTWSHMASNLVICFE